MNIDRLLVAVFASPVSEVLVRWGIVTATFMPSCAALIAHT